VEGPDPVLALDLGLAVRVPFAAERAVFADAVGELEAITLDTCTKVRTLAFRAAFATTAVPSTFTARKSSMRPYSRTMAAV
jgi:hypothetical protein